MNFKRVFFLPAHAGQAHEISRLVNSAYRGESSKQGWTTEESILGGQRVDPEMIVEIIEKKGNRIELMRGADGALIACMHLQYETAADSLYVGMLTVDPRLQAQGHGKQLLARAEELARDVGLRQVQMSVIDLREELIAYYERRGYQKTGRVIPFPKVNPRLGLPKVDGLKLIEMVKPLF